MSLLHCQWAAGVTGEYEQALPDCVSNPDAQALVSTRAIHSARYQSGRVGGKY